MPALSLEAKYVLAAGLITLVGVGLIQLMGLPEPGPRIEPGVMPACDSPQARHLLQRTIETAPLAKAARLRIVKLGTFAHYTETQTYENQFIARICTGEVFASTGRHSVPFKMEWLDTAKREVFLTVPQLPL